MFFYYSWIPIAEHSTKHVVNVAFLHALTFNTESIPSLRVLHVHNVRDWQPPWTSIHLRRGGKVLDSAEGIRQGREIDLIV